MLKRVGLEFVPTPSAPEGAGGDSTPMRGQGDTGGGDDDKDKNDPDKPLSLRVNFLRLGVA